MQLLPSFRGAAYLVHPFHLVQGPLHLYPQQLMQVIRRFPHEAALLPPHFPPAARLLQPLHFLVEHIVLLAQQPVYFLELLHFTVFAALSAVHFLVGFHLFGLN